MRNLDPADLSAVRMSGKHVPRSFTQDTSEVPTLERGETKDASS